jgi:primosomal protein N' (replication factor Y)
MHYYEIVPTKIFRTNAESLTYHSDHPLPPNTLVLIPLGKKSTPGLLLHKVPKPPFPTKPITKILHPTPLPPHLTKAIKWLSHYYATPLPITLQTALPTGLEKSRKPPKPTPSPTHSIPLTPLTPAQQKAFQSISTNPQNTILLHGITGSGKTNIYLHLTAATLKKGQSVIVLSPEIALTSQLITNFKQHFPATILLHSQQTQSERHLLWTKILEAPTPLVIIGPRSALFAPLKHLGLIIIDEAHEPTYSQDQSPKYSALRLASTMSKTILGTATPLITDYYLATKKQSLIELKELAIKSDKTAQITIIDSKNRDNFRWHHLFSDPLLAAIKSSLATKTQSLIFHNRRGSTPLTICNHCGWQALCPTCYLPLTLHADLYSLICHTCGHRTTVPTSCPHCHNPQIIHKGIGTKLLESELTRLFPSTKIARFDADNREADCINNLYTDVKAGTYSILIGTQILAKGFDLPKLTTLGIVQADNHLSLPDFSAEERTYQLLTQVIGRANRGHQNTQIFIQTYQPNHPIINFAHHNDYASLYPYLLKKRQPAHLPPYQYLLKLTLTYKTEKSTITNIKKLQSSIAALIKDHPPSSIPTISAPTPAFHEKTASGYTWQLTIKSKSRQTLLKILSSLPPNPHLHTHLDPSTLL